MSLTLGDLWSAVARNLGGPYLDSTATGGSTTTIVDTTNLPAMGANDYFDDAFACIITDAGGAHAAPEGETRVVNDFVRSTGTITVASAFTVAPAVGDTYRLWAQLPRADLVSAVKAALRAAWPAFYAEAVDETIPLVTNTYEYALPSTIQHLTEVYIQADSAQTHWHLVPDWRYKDSGATDTLVLNPDHSYTVGYYLRLVGVGPLSLPTYDYSTLTIAARYEQELLDYVGLRGAAYCHAWLLSRDTDNRDLHLTRQRELETQAKDARGKRMPRPPMRAVVDYPRYWSKE